MPLYSVAIPSMMEIDDYIVRIETQGDWLADQINIRTEKIKALRKYHREKIAPEYEPLLDESIALHHERIEAEREAGGNREFALLWAEAACFADGASEVKHAEKVLAEVKEEESEAEVTKRLDKAIGTARWAYSNITDLSNESYAAALELAPRLKKALEDLREFKKTKAPRLAVLDAEFKKIKAEIDQLDGESDFLDAEITKLEEVYKNELAKRKAEEGGVIASGGAVAVAAGGGASSAAATASYTTATASSGSRSGSGSSPGSGSSIGTPFAAHPIAAAAPLPVATAPAAAVAARPLPVAASAGTPSTLMPTMAIASTAAAAVAARPAPANTNISPGVKQAALAAPAKDSCIIM